MKNKTLRKTSKKLNKRKKISGGEETLKFEKDLGIIVANLLEGIKQIDQKALLDLIKVYYAHQNTIIGLLTPKKEMYEVIEIEKITNLYVAIQTFCHTHLDAGLGTFINLIKDITEKLYHSGDYGRSQENSDYLKNIMTAIEENYRNACAAIPGKTCKNTKGVLKILHAYVNILHNTADMQINDMLAIGTVDIRKAATEGDQQLKSIHCIIDSLQALGDKSQDTANKEAVKSVLQLLRNYLKPLSGDSLIGMGSSALTAITNPTTNTLITQYVVCSWSPHESKIKKVKEDNPAIKDKFETTLKKAGVKNMEEWVKFGEKNNEYLKSLLIKQKEKKTGMISTLKKAFGIGQPRRGGKTKKKRPAISR